MTLEDWDKFPLMNGKDFPEYAEVGGTVRDVQRVEVDGFEFDQHYLHLIWSQGPGIKYVVISANTGGFGNLLFETHSGHQGILLGLT